MPRLLFVVLAAVLVMSGCSAESKSVAVSSPNGNMEIATNGEVSQVVELEPDASEVRVWLCSGGNSVFDNETCSTQIESRKTIQDTIFERYPSFRISRILRGKDTWTVYYVSLKKN